MNKILAVFVIIAVVIGGYLILLVLQPSIIDIASSANTSLATTSNMSNYAGTQEGILASPYLLFFIPAAIGIYALVLKLRQP